MHYGLLFPQGCLFSKWLNNMMLRCLGKLYQWSEMYNQWLFFSLPCRVKNYIYQIKKNKTCHVIVKISHLNLPAVNIHTHFAKTSPSHQQIHMKLIHDRLSQSWTLWSTHPLLQSAVCLEWCPKRWLADIVVKVMCFCTSHWWITHDFL